MSLPYLPTIHIIQSQEEYDAIKSGTAKGLLKGSSGLVVLDCYAEWHPHCKGIENNLQQFAEEYPQVDFFKVNIDTLPDVAVYWGVRSMPTFVFLKHGKLVDQVKGPVLPAVVATIRKHMA